MDHIVVSAPELAHLLASVRVGEEASTAAGTPVVVADFRDAIGTAEGYPGDLVGVLPSCVLVALVGPDTSPDWMALAQRCDLVLERDEDVAEVRAAVMANPLASTALVLLLRGSAARSIDEGLVAESTLYSLLQAGPEFARWRAGRVRKAPVAQDGPVVLADRHLDELRLTINRPRVHNAFSSAVRDLLSEGLELAAFDDSLRRVVIDGNGPSFSSGGDLDEFGSFTDPVTSHLTRLTRSPARLVTSMADRIEFRLHGACMGAGIELPAFAHRVVCTSDARVALPEVRYGLIPGAGGTVSVTRRIGRHRSAFLALSGRVIDGLTALRWGLVDELVD